MLETLCACSMKVLTSSCLDASLTVKYDYPVLIVMAQLYFLHDLATCIQVHACASVHTCTHIHTHVDVHVHTYIMYVLAHL